MDLEGDSRQRAFSSTSLVASSFPSGGNANPFILKLLGLQSNSSNYPYTLSCTHGNSLVPSQEASVISRRNGEAYFQPARGPHPSLKRNTRRRQRKQILLVGGQEPPSALVKSWLTQLPYWQRFHEHKVSIERSFEEQLALHPLLRTTSSFINHGVEHFCSSVAQGVATCLVQTRPLLSRLSLPPLLSQLRDPEISMAHPIPAGCRQPSPSCNLGHGRCSHHGSVLASPSASPSHRPSIVLSAHSPSSLLSHASDSASDGDATPSPQPDSPPSPTPDPAPSPSPSSSPSPAPSAAPGPSPAPDTSRTDAAATQSSGTSSSASGGKGKGSSLDSSEAGKDAWGGVPLPATGPAFMGRVFTTFDFSGRSLLDHLKPDPAPAPPPTNVPALLRPFHAWMERQAAEIRKSLPREKPNFRFFFTRDNAVEFLAWEEVNKGLPAVNSIIRACPLELAYNLTQLSAMLFKFVADERQVERARALLRKEKGRRAADAFEGVPIFTARNLTIAVATSGGIRWFTPYFFDERQLDSLVGHGVDMHFQMLVQTRRMNRRIGGSAAAGSGGQAGAGAGGAADGEAGGEMPDDDPEGMLDPPEVHDFMSEMGQGGVHVESALVHAAGVLTQDCVDSVLLGSKWGRRFAGLQPRFPIIVDSFERRAAAAEAEAEAAKARASKSQSPAPKEAAAAASSAASATSSSPAGPPSAAPSPPHGTVPGPKKEPAAGVAGAPPLDPSPLSSRSHRGDLSALPAGSLRGAEGGGGEQGGAPAGSPTNSSQGGAGKNEPQAYSDGHSGSSSAVGHCSSSINSSSSNPSSSPGPGSDSSSSKGGERGSSSMSGSSTGGSSVGAIRGRSSSERGEASPAPRAATAAAGAAAAAAGESGATGNPGLGGEGLPLRAEGMPSVRGDDTSAVAERSQGGAHAGPPHPPPSFPPGARNGSGTDGADGVEAGRRDGGPMARLARGLGGLWHRWQEKDVRGRERAAGGHAAAEQDGPRASDSEKRGGEWHPEPEPERERGRELEPWEILQPHLTMLGIAIQQTPGSPGHDEFLQHALAEAAKDYEDRLKRGEGPGGTHGPIFIADLGDPQEAWTYKKSMASGSSSGGSGGDSGNGGIGRTSGGGGGGSGADVKDNPS